MVVGTLELHLRIEGSFSLKDKRRVLRSLMDRVRREFQVSVAEVGDQDLWNVATVGVACVSNNQAHSESVLASVVEAFDRCPEASLEACQKSFFRPGEELA